MGPRRLNLLAVSGSLRAQSTNSKLLAAAKNLSPEQTHFHIFEGIDQLPFFSPDIDPEANQATVLWIDQVRQCDGFIVSTPEYARGYPGVLKNALDWLVQTDAFIEKPFMFLHGSNRSSVAKDTLAVVIETMSGIQVKDANLTIHLVGSALSAVEIEEQHGAEVLNSLSCFVEALKTR